MPRDYDQEIADLLRAFDSPPRPNGGIDTPDDIGTPAVQWPDPLAEEAYQGLAGELVRMIEPHSETDPAAILIQFLVASGNLISRSAYFSAEADRHNTSLYAVIVGQTSKGRKGTSWGQVRRLLENLDTAWLMSALWAALHLARG